MMTAPRPIAACSNRLGEAPVWLAEQNALLWLDLPTGLLWRWQAASGAVTSVKLDAPTPVGAIVRTSDDDTLLLTHARGVSRLDLRDMSLAPFADPEQRRDDVMYNDAKVDPFGRLWAGTSHVSETEPRGALWMIHRDRTAELVDAGFAIANGPAFAPDGSVAYFSDSLARRVLAYDLGGPDHRPRNRRAFCRFSEADGLPDGLTVDRDGCLWIAHWATGRVSRWSPAGKKLAEIQLPVGNVTSLCFGGPDLATLYITTAWDALSDAARAALPQSGDLFCIDAPVPGPAEPRFAL